MCRSGLGGWGGDLNDEYGGAMGAVHEAVAVHRPLHPPPHSTTSPPLALAHWKGKDLEPRREAPPPRDRAVWLGGGTVVVDQRSNGSIRRNWWGSEPAG